MNPDIAAALFVATPQRANSASWRRGVAWWGEVCGTGTCDCCGNHGPVRKGYNGGAHLSTRFCVPCTTAGHDGCQSHA